jgi:glutathione peroxidase
MNTTSDRRVPASAFPLTRATASASASAVAVAVASAFASAFMPVLASVLALPFALPIALALVAVPARAQAPAAATPCPTLLKHTVPRLQDERPQDLCQYTGRVLLVVNTASYCGFAPQFEGLEALNAKYAARGLVVMGFPSNDFLQEDADAKKTAAVCFNTYGVRFPMFVPIKVRGSQAHPLFAALATATGSAPGWNFNKYLVGRDGRPIAHFGSRVAPADPALVGAIERALQGR